MKSVFISSIIAVTLFATANTYAATTNGGVIHFEGELVNAACAVNTESADQVVSPGQYRTDLFNAVGATSASIPFTIELNDCDVSIAATAAVAFSGQADGNNDDLLAIVSGTNVATATGVGIEILDNTSKTLKPDGSVFSEAQSLITGTNVLHFSARYMGTGLSATAGQANADATFIMQYP
ncbi:TPA: type 1 fimbrial major subunit FimA [Escherichia albertii]|uniref:type 1 fimbrial major subunit FimA n=1 Tax=Escherichia albertii TaxID=208962 RepID=UPI0021E8AB0D|nr:type 1 fimbrial major subunit FimA [Escherichia albertii]MCV3222851.1 type 1 fimbrial major subunit FimA [Escherichia albertii]